MNCPTCGRATRTDIVRTDKARITVLICDRCSSLPVNWEKIFPFQKGVIGMSQEPNATHDTITDLLSRVSDNPTAQTAAAVALNIFSLNCWGLFGKGLTEEQLQSGIQEQRNKLAHNLRELVEGREEF